MLLAVSVLLLTSLNLIKGDDSTICTPLINKVFNTVSSSSLIEKFEELIEKQTLLGEYCTNEYINELVSMNAITDKCSFSFLTCYSSGTEQRIFDKLEQVFTALDCVAMMKEQALKEDGTPCVKDLQQLEFHRHRHHHCRPHPPPYPPPYPPPPYPPHRRHHCHHHHHRHHWPWSSSDEEEEDDFDDMIEEDEENEVEEISTVLPMDTVQFRPEMMDETPFDWNWKEKGLERPPCRASWEKVDLPLCDFQRRHHHHPHGHYPPPHCHRHHHRRFHIFAGLSVVAAGLSFYVYRRRKQAQQKAAAEQQLIPESYFPLPEQQDTKA